MNLRDETLHSGVNSGWPAIFTCRGSGNHGYVYKRGSVFCLLVGLERYFKKAVTTARVREKHVECRGIGTTWDQDQRHGSCGEASGTHLYRCIHLCSKCLVVVVGMGGSFSFRALQREQETKNGAFLIYASNAPMATVWRNRARVWRRSWPAWESTLLSESFSIRGWPFSLIPRGI